MDIPEGSIYFWMYQQGLRQAPFDEVVSALDQAGKEIRKKDAENYWNGWYNSRLYKTHNVLEFQISSRPSFLDLRYDEYAKHPYLGQPEILNRWVPCNEDGKPLFKWSNGCLTKIDALCMRGCRMLAENMKGTRMVVIDCDGDHDKEHLDLDAIRFLSKYMSKTHCIVKPKKVSEYDPRNVAEDDPVLELPASFHLTFQVDRLIPTMHFPSAHMDIVGNQANSLRYWKNKEWNGIEPAAMTNEIWEDLKVYVGGRL